MSQDASISSPSPIRRLCLRPGKDQWVTITHAGQTMRVRWIKRHTGGTLQVALQFDATEDWAMLRDDAIRRGPAPAGDGARPAGPAERRRGA
jgi:hypothetical protein